MKPIAGYGRQWIDDHDIAAVVEVLRGDWLTQGPAVDRFEKTLAERCGARYVVAVSNGTVALHLACRALGLGHGDEGITSPITFLASATCMVSCGALPRFADIESSTWNIDPRAVESAITEHTRALIPVDFAGLPCDLERLRTIADRHGLALIEDACHSLGGSYRGKPIGGTGLADMVCFSFHPVKAITTGEGGAIATDDDSLARRLRQLRHHGMTKDPKELISDEGPWHAEMHQLGLNGRLTDIQCALGTSQLSKLDRFIERRREIVSRYRQAFAKLEGVSTQAQQDGRQSAHHLFVLRLEPARYDRGKIFEALGDRGIHCQVHYPPVHLQPFFRRTFSTGPGDCPVAESYATQCLSLPLFPAMTDEEVERVIRDVSDVLSELV